MSWLLSITSVIMLWLMGNKNKYAPYVGIFNQGLWIFYVITTKQYGLLLGVIMYLVVHIRNAVKWRNIELL